MEPAENLEVLENADAPIESPEGDALPVVEELPALEPLPQWPSDLRDNFQKWGELESGRDIQSVFLDTYKNHDRVHGELGQKLDAMRQQYAPIDRVMEQHKDALAMARMAPDVAINHALTFANLAATSPQEAINYIAKHGGVDLAKMIEDAPYVDPAVREVEQKLGSKVQQLEQLLQSREQEKAQDFEKKVRAAAHEFETANENGALKYPYISERDAEGSPYVLQRVAEAAMTDINQGKVPDYAQYYEQVCWQIPAIREKLIAEQTKQVASQTEAAAQKAKEASKTVKGSGDGKAKPTLKSVEDAVKAASASMEWPS